MINNVLKLNNQFMYQYFYYLINKNKIKKYN